MNLGCLVMLIVCGAFWASMVLLAIVALKWLALLAGALALLWLYRNIQARL